MDVEPSSRAPVPGAARALALLLAINLFNYIDRYILAAVEPLISNEFFPHEAGAPADIYAQAKTGGLATAFIVSYMLFAPLFGAMADRVSRWLIIAGGVAIWSLASGWSGFANTFIMLVVSRIFVGIGEAAYGPAAPTIIADSYPIEKRGRMISYFYIAIPVGSALGYAIGGWLGGAYGWRAPFFAVVAPGLVLAGLCLLMRDPRNLPGAGRSQAENKPRVTLRTVAALFRIRSYFFNTAAMTALTFAIGGISYWVPRYFFVERAADFGGTPDLKHINLVFGGITLVAGLSATLLGGICGDKLRMRFPSSYFLVSGAAMMLAFPATLAMLESPFPWAWVLVFVAEFFLFFNTGPANAALANVTPPAIRSSAFAVNIFFIHAFGDAISPPLIGWIAGQTSMKFAFGIVSIVMLLAGSFWLIGARYLGEDTARVEKLSAG